MDGPTIACLQVGNVNGGAVDAVGRIASTVRRGDLWAAECPQPAQCLAGTARVWLVVSGRHAEPLAAVPGAKGDALRTQFTVTQVWPRPGLTVALLTSRPGR